MSAYWLTVLCRFKDDVEDNPVDGTVLKVRLEGLVGYVNNTTHISKRRLNVSSQLPSGNLLECPEMPLTLRML